MTEFKKRFFGKWVLAGEYSVLRGLPALVYPLSHYFMDFHYKESNTPIQVKRKGNQGERLNFSLDPLFKKALKMSNKKKSDLKGSLIVNSSIPPETGLGASSVLCVGIASLFLYKGWILQKKMREFAISLEDFFHGKSSGMDVNVVLEKKAILYQKEKKIKYPPRFKIQPNLFLSYSGEKSSTAVGMSIAKKWFNKNRKQAEQMDKNMAQSVKICLLALKERDKGQCKKMLTQALSLGEKCFHKWGLISPMLKKHIAYLKKQGALAVKPTGSGLGGHVISLWDDEPPSSIKKDLIPLNI